MVRPFHWQRAAAAAAVVPAPTVVPAAAGVTGIAGLVVPDAAVGLVGWAARSRVGRRAAAAGGTAPTTSRSMRPSPASARRVVAAPAQHGWSRCVAP